ncbi:putative protein OS=Tsukamurella paurometabola (strain ATCC 8368 / DSM / CCUG 35730 /CIP 100753 / JCM 10117 / KCTC 9821 / NBRC 16120 / NCIMB 702349/ NCTC 13040) OX=521096 GN=Tpau_3899 PE=4 SV=1 [Tsukamurella paurometabola]|uniref:Uncharacterized protein n=1 Tax=Tsukamurella paurometabola (strain ATCC 8368 / DSM 20162 / CCUG 35730 / CIP 100753 / JCM 10117 / KCTC 9821 / NBRC 16120 / NCIMB 702349 / NCTC 13040) TaxID=521096 RepID=D5UMJ7_TSUPD|nr:hypothetical protein [Tsukamurella paurometabola]ADG80471.1 conserved hypothetical protein [Tsukamurella paurometabola DSM 20162]SUP39768.1 Uncharacterised protein [Tsukamurella paurometabola]
MAAVTGAAVAAFLGQGDEQTVALAEEHARIVTAQASAYTRGKGFVDGEPNDEIASVIVTAAARLAAHPEQIFTSVGNVNLRGSTGWTVTERIVLDRYREKAL